MGTWVFAVSFAQSYLNLTIQAKRRTFICSGVLSFLKPFFKGKIFCLVASDSARREDHFQKKICPKRTFPSNFGKIGLKNTLFIFGRKNGRLLLLLLFVVAIFCPILACFF